MAKLQTLEMAQETIMHDQQKILDKLDKLENILTGWTMSHTSTENPSATSPCAPCGLPSSRWARSPWQMQPVFQTSQYQRGMALPQVQQDAMLEHQPVRTPAPAGNDNGSTHVTAPLCHPLPAQSSDSHALPSERIAKDKLASPQVILSKYYKLRGDALAGTLGVKLAREAYFGPEVMKLCTVRGNRGFPGLPHAELCQLKQTLFSVFPQFWANPVEFEPVWTKCSAAIGQACKALRFKASGTSAPQCVIYLCTCKTDFVCLCTCSCYNSVLCALYGAVELWYMYLQMYVFLCQTYKLVLDLGEGWIRANQNIPCM